MNWFLRTLLLAFPLLLTLSGCEGVDPSTQPRPVAVSLQPESVSVPPGETQQFTARVEGGGDTSLTWSTTGGTITPEGLFTAPETLGRYTVRATSVADARVFIEASVTVAILPPRILLFQAARTNLKQGQSTVLDWEVRGATSLSLSPEPGTFSGSRVDVTPPTTTTYTLTATGEGGTSTATATVRVWTEDWRALSWKPEQPGGYNSDVYRWLDSGQQLRTAVLTRNEGQDPGGTYGGMLRQFRFFTGTQERVATGTGASQKWNGWGYVVNHYDKEVSRSADVAGRYRQVFVGPHHALHEYSWQLPLRNQQVRATVHWFLATGRENPVYAITFDSSASGPNGVSVSIDSRAPYGDIAWDGDGTQAEVDGVKWGDKYRFFSRDEPLTARSRWDYSQPNVVPYAMAYSRRADAEMGLVQTLDWKTQNAGDAWFHTNWGRTSENRVLKASSLSTWRMPDSWNWPYQLCQYEMDDTRPTRSKRVAWGLMYGAVGKPSYWGYGYERKYSGHPYQSYSVFMVMGQQSTEAVMDQVAQVERTLGAELRVNRGQAVQEGPGGVGRTDTVSYPVPGYNSTYGVYELQADALGLFNLTLRAVAGALRNPIFLVRNMPGVPDRLTLDGTELVPDLDYFASFDASTQTLWLTLNGSWSGSHILAVPPSTSLP